MDHTLVVVLALDAIALNTIVLIMLLVDFMQVRHKPEKEQPKSEEPFITDIPIGRRVSILWWRKPQTDTTKKTISDQFQEHFGYVPIIIAGLEFPDVLIVGERTRDENKPLAKKEIK